MRQSRAQLNTPTPQLVYIFEEFEYWAIVYKCERLGTELTQLFNKAVTNSVYFSLYLKQTSDVLEMETRNYNPNIEQSVRKRVLAIGEKLIGICSKVCRRVTITNKLVRTLADSLLKLKE